MKKIRLSASKLSLYCKCSYLYYLTYVINFPRTGNDGSNRGICTHKILELLAKKNRVDLVDQIVKSNKVSENSLVGRLVTKLAKKNNVNTPENIALIHLFMIKALTTDFWCEGAKKVHVEFPIKLEGEHYTAIGYVDKVIEYDDSITILDFKTSKARKSKEELDFDFQNYFYTLALRKLYPDKPIKLIFQFLKYKKDPNQEAPALSDQELAGFESYLEYIAQELSNFTEAKSRANLAKADIKRRFLCGKQCGEMNAAGTAEAFICPAKYPRAYFVLKNAKGDVIDSAFFPKDLDDKKVEGCIVEKRFNPGCPGWAHEWK